MFNIKDFIEDQSEASTDWEIDLSPLLALMVTLIPVLLLQTSFASLQMLETTLPVISDVKQEVKDKDKDKIDFKLNIFAKQDRSINLEALVNNKKVHSKILKATESEFDFENFKKELIGLKNKYPEEVSAKLIPDDKIGYEKIIKILDVVRKTDDKNMIKYVDKSGSKIETAMLFPDVVFGNIAD